MTIKDEYLLYKADHDLKANSFDDRVKLQEILQANYDRIWAEQPTFTNGGLFRNHMTGFALGFAYYDCRPSDFCKTRCYGLPIAGVNDYYMFRLSVITSEALRRNDPRFLAILSEKIRSLKYLKIGHWGDAVLDQVPVIVKLAQKNPTTIFWWYTKKIEIALAANSRKLPNLRAYLSLDPTTEYPGRNSYPYRLTYFFGDKQFHDNHEEILSDERLTALFVMKNKMHIEDPKQYGVHNHPKMCIEKKIQQKKKTIAFCLHCTGRCNYRTIKIQQP